MNQITINRLIGGGVLVFASALFVPAILSPTAMPLQNPKLSVSIEKNKTVVPESGSISLASSPSNKQNNTEIKPLELESLGNTTPAKKSQSIGTVNAGKGRAKPRELMPVSLESVGGSASQPSTVAAKKTSASTVSWLRVGSFSTKMNADKVVNALRLARYSVKTEVVAVGGQTFRRVLVGPFSDENKMAKIMKGIKARGYNPSVQR